MKKKWKTLKRHWRKLHRMDRQGFRMFGAFAILYLLLSFWSSVYLLNLIAMVLLGILHFFHLCIRRNRQYAYYIKGCIHQSMADWMNYERTMFEYAALKFKYDRLNDDYKKLESDYNQLKKKDNIWKQTSNGK